MSWRNLLFPTLTQFLAGLRDQAAAEVLSGLPDLDLEKALEYLKTSGLQFNSIEKRAQKSLALFRDLFRVHF